MISQDDWDRLARFVAGECTPGEARAIACWADEAPERREALAFIRDLDIAAEVGRPQWDTDASWAKLTIRRSAQTRLPLRLTPDAAQRRGGWPRRLAAAAVIMIAAGTAVGTWHLRRGAGNPRDIADMPTRVMHERTAPRGQRLAFTLPDGTPVLLAPASRLRYPTSFTASSGRRDVYLDGKASFEVRHDEHRPFLVHTAHGVTEDLGTRFTVREYLGDTTVEVVVAEGHVELRRRIGARAGAGARLREGQLGYLTLEGGVVVQSDVDLGRYFAWTQGRLVFEDTPLRDALPELGRWYDLDFVLADSALGSRHLTTVLAGERIAETLTLLGAALDIRYERHGRTITLSSRLGR